MTSATHVLLLSLSTKMTRQGLRNYRELVREFNIQRPTVRIQPSNHCAFYRTCSCSVQGQGGSGILQWLTVWVAVHSLRPKAFDEAWNRFSLAVKHSL